MKCAFINLDRATARRAFMEQQGARLGLHVERHRAITPGDVPEAVLTQLGGTWERPLTGPEIACFLSHRALWAHVAAGRQPMLLMEDDVVLSPRVPALLAAMDGRDGFDVVNLESFDRRRFLSPGTVTLGGGLRLLAVSRDKAGAAAYVLWPEGARRLMAASENRAAPADAFLHGLKALRSFQSDPALAMQVHILAARGLPVPIAVTTYIQAPRGRLSLTPANAPFHARRVATQVRLAGEHVKRLFGNSYRMVDIVEDEFMPPGAEDHSRS